MGKCWKCCVHSACCPEVPLACPVYPRRNWLQASENVIKWSRWECKKIKKWFDKNRRLIWTLHSLLGCSPELIQYFLLKLLHSNFGSLFNMNGPKGRSYYVPLTGVFDGNQKNIFDSWGNLKEPLRPSNIMHLFKAIREYISTKITNLSSSQLNLVLKNGLIQSFHPDDPLVRLLQKINANVGIDLDKFLDILLKTDPAELVKKLPKSRRVSRFREIERLYMSVVTPSKNIFDPNLVTNSLSNSSTDSSRDRKRFSNSKALFGLQKLFDKSMRGKRRRRRRLHKNLPTPTPRSSRKLSAEYYFATMYPPKSQKNSPSASKKSSRQYSLISTYPTKFFGLKENSGSDLLPRAMIRIQRLSPESPKKSRKWSR